MAAAETDRVIEVEGFEPAADNYLVRRVASPNETKLVMPDVVKAREKTALGRVLAVGVGKWDATRGVRVPCCYSVGDLILFTSYGSEAIPVPGLKTEEGQSIYLVREVDTLGRYKTVEPTP